MNEACRAVCDVIAPKDSDELLRSFQESRREVGFSSDLKALVTAYQQAPSRSLKIQILSIYATSYPAQYLKKIPEPFEKLSDQQIKRARAHAKIVGVGLSVEKPRRHRVKIDLVKFDHFLSFVDQPYFYEDVAYETRTLKLDSGEELLVSNDFRIVARSTMIEQYLSIATKITLSLFQDRRCLEYCKSEKFLKENRFKDWIAWLLEVLKCLKVCAR